LNPKGQAGKKEKKMKTKFLVGLLVFALLAIPLTGYAKEEKVIKKVPPKGVTLEVLNPRGEIEPPPTLAPTTRVTDLAGKRVGLYWNGKVGTDVFFDTVEKLLKEKFPTIKVLRYVGAFDLGDALAPKIAKEVDTFIYGVGD
jgi:hypothetical protein